eukprot:gene9092-9262_t
MSKKWVPYQHKHQGVAVYLHINVSDGCDYLGGEFMVSSIINGTPEQCLAALKTNNSSAVGILGPAMQSKLLQTDGQSQVFWVRGPHYLADRAKVAAGSAGYRLAAVDQVATPTAVPHLAQYLPSVRFIHGDDGERSNMLKLIPHLAEGSWLLKQVIGTTPCIIGRKLATSYHLTDRYMEIDVDVTTCKTAGYIVNSIRSMTTALVVDLAFLLEGQRPQELPEVLIGAARFSNIDLSDTVPVDLTRVVPCWPEPWLGP